MKEYFGNNTYCIVNKNGDVTISIRNGHNVVCEILLESETWDNVQKFVHDKKSHASQPPTAPTEE